MNSLFGRTHLVRTILVIVITPMWNSLFGRMRRVRTSLALRSRCAAIPTHSSRTSELTNNRRKTESGPTPRSRRPRSTIPESTDATLKAHTLAAIGGWIRSMTEGTPTFRNTDA